MYVVCVGVLHEAGGLCKVVHVSVSLGYFLLFGFARGGHVVRGCFHRLKIAVFILVPPDL